jgi:UDP-N-acetylglucosamine 4-epimerase
MFGLVGISSIAPQYHRAWLTIGRDAMTHRGPDGVAEWWLSDGLVNELYAEVFAWCYGFNTIGQRYFNVFVQRLDPNGTYAAVIPKWTDALMNGGDIFINGDGEISSDFCFVDNIVQANLMAANTKNPAAVNQVYIVALGERTSLNKLYQLIATSLPAQCSLQASKLIHRDFRASDVRHSLTDISKAQILLGYARAVKVDAGIVVAMPWYIDQAYDK